MFASMTNGSPGFNIAVGPNKIDAEDALTHRHFAPLMPANSNTIAHMNTFDDIPALFVAALKEIMSELPSLVKVTEVRVGAGGD